MQALGPRSLHRRVSMAMLLTESLVWVEMEGVMKLDSPELLIFLLFVGVVQVVADDRVDRLTGDERAWLEQEVPYIISPQEKEVFLDLETKEERGLFVETFWDRRDPNPATLENEFAKEHYRRLEHAIRVLGREAPRPGWKTDRGRYYIILGEPHEIQRYDGSNEIVSTELWIYMGDREAGLPARFNLLFFKNNDIGEYELYHPHSDGPQALLHDGFSLRANQNRALDILETISVDLAKASLTIDLSEPTSSMFSARNSRDPTLMQVPPSMSVDRNLLDIEEYQIKKIDADYLQGYLDFGDRVSADYSFNFVESRAAFAVLIGPGETPFVHYSIELDPQNLSLEANEEETLFYTTFEVSLELRNMEGQLLAVTENERPLRLTRSQLDQIGSLPFAYRDSFPVLPGVYKVSIILRNRATKEFTVSDTEIIVPEPSDETRLADLILAANLQTDFTGGDAFKTFRLGGTAIEPITNGVFALGKSAYVATQVLNAQAGQSMRFLIQSTGETLASYDAEVSTTSDGLVTAEIPLLGIEPGDYSFRGEILDADANIVTFREVPIRISPRSTILRAGLVLPYSFPADVEGLIDLTLGEQLMARGQIDDAETRLRAAVAAINPGMLPMAQWKLASLILFKRQADEALSLLKPLEAQFPEQVEVVEGLGFAYYIKSDYPQALPYLERARTLRPVDTSLLNALGDCYERQQQPNKAKEMFELSLQMNSEQNGVKVRLASLGE